MWKVATYTFYALLLLASFAVDANTPPNTAIYNQAHASYYDEEFGITHEVISNTSRVMVGHSYSFILDDEKIKYVAPAQQVHFDHIVTNTGNSIDSYTLLFENLEGDDGELVNLRAYHDVNANGVVDAGEPEISSIQNLEPDASVNIVVLGNTRANQRNNDEIDILVTVTSQHDASDVKAVTDKAIVREGAIFTLNKFSHQQCEAPLTAGELIHYSIEFSNTGTSLPSPRTISLDGVPYQGVVLEDKIPANTFLLPNQDLDVSPIQAIPLVRLSGSESQNWQPYESWDGTVPAVSFGLLIPVANVQPNQSGSVSFAVQIEPGVSNNTMIYNQAEIDFSGTNSDILFSNRVCNSVAAQNVPEIRFQSARPEMVASGQVKHSNDAHFMDTSIYSMPGEQSYDALLDGVFLRLVASQLNRDLDKHDFVHENGVELLLARVESQLSGDSVQVVMKETERNSGVFRSLQPLVLSGIRTADGEICSSSATAASAFEFTSTTTTNEVLGQGCYLNSAFGDILNVTFDVPVEQAAGFGQRMIRVSDVAAVEPSGRVFDTSSGKAVNGALVSLFQSKQVFSNAGPSACASLTAEDFEPARDRFTGEVIPAFDSGSMNRSGNSDGLYSFARAATDHCYYIGVTPPDGYEFPSSVSPISLRAFSSNLGEHSYGLIGYLGDGGRLQPVGDGMTTTNEQGDSKGAFSLGLAWFPDIPLDPEDSLVAGELFLEKTVDTEVIAAGDYVSYRLSISNSSAVPLLGFRIVDKPAYGLRYESGTARMTVGNGVAIELPDPVRDEGGYLVFPRIRDENGANLLLEPGATLDITYVMRASVAVNNGRLVNQANVTARNEGGFLFTSNEAEASVTVRNEGVLSDRGIIFGKVFVDTTCSSTQELGEWVIPGVRLYLQDGTWVVTDEDGMFSIHGLRPGLKTLAVDPATMPAGVTLKPITTRHAGDGTSRFVDLVPGEMHRADFAIACPDARNIVRVRADIEARRENANSEWVYDSILANDPLRNRAAGTRIRSAGAGGDLGSGFYDETLSRGLDPMRSAERETPQTSIAEGQLTSPLADAPEMLESVDQARIITSEQATAGVVLWPENGVSRDGRLQVVVQAGVTPELTINGKAVAKEQLGEQIENISEQGQVVTWYGLQFTPGENHVVVQAVDPFGNLRTLIDTMIVRPGSAKALQLTAQDEPFFADGGTTRMPITIELFDSEGYHASGSNVVTLLGNDLRFAEADLQPDTMGQQVRIVDGKGTIHLLSSFQTGFRDVHARFNDLNDSIAVQQITPVRELFATGYISAKKVWGDFTNNGDVPADIESIEQEQSGLESGMFVTGSVGERTTLTLAFDSERALSDEEEIRRDLNPGDYYPVSGDASIRGYDAKSQSRVYARVERGASSLLWGDFVTDANTDFQDVGRIQQILTGANLTFDNQTTRLQLFGAKVDYQQVTEEIRGNGTALLYQTSAPPVRESEIIEFIVRDRNNPGLVIETRPLRRGVDYSINYFTGDLRFFDVIPSVDDEFNPVFLRITYNVDGSSVDYDVYGARLQHKLSDSLTLSGSFTENSHDIDGYSLSSVTSLYELGNRTRAFASYGRMQNLIDEDGDALSVGLQHQWENGSFTDIRWARANDGFRNPTSGIGEAREELRAEHEQQISSRTSARFEARKTQDLSTDAEQSSVAFLALRQFDNVRATVGSRAIEQRDTDGDDRFGTYILGLASGFDVFGKPLTLGAEYEQAFSDSSKQRIAADADLAITQNTGFYARYEFLNSIAGMNQITSDVETEQFVAGVRTRAFSNTDLFSEYRLRGAQDGQDVALANGVRSAFEIEPGLTWSPSVEWIRVLDGNESQAATAYSLGFEDIRSANRRTLGRVETRFGNGRRYYGVSLANIWRISQNWSGVIRNDMRVQYSDTESRNGDHIVTLGFARRPRLDNKHHSMFMYQWRKHWGGDLGPDRVAHVLSNHHNLELKADLVLSGRIGGKWQSFEQNDLALSNAIYIADGRVIWGVTRRLDIDVRAGIMSARDENEQRFSYGISANYLIRKNLRMGVGYNVRGFKDNDLDPEGYNAQGLHIGLDYKISADDFAWIGNTAAGIRSFIGAN